MPAPCSINRRTLIKHLGVSGSLLAASCGWPVRLFAENPGARTFGIDVSKWGGEIDWHEVVAKLGPRFVFVQAYHVGKSEASSYANPRFANYRRDLQRLGLLHGAYLRCHPTANAETSIKRFWAAYTPRPGDLLPTLDIEDDYDDRCALPVPKRIDQIEKMVRLVSTRIGGQRPMIYTKARVWSELGNPTQFADCPLWVVDYHSTAAPPSHQRGPDSVFGSTQKICMAMAFREHMTATISMAPRRTCRRISCAGSSRARDNPSPASLG